MKFMLTGMTFVACLVRIHADGRIHEQRSLPFIFYDQKGVENKPEYQSTLSIESLKSTPLPVLESTGRLSPKVTGMKKFNEMKESLPLLWQNKDRRHLILSLMPCDQLLALLKQNVMFRYLIPQSSLSSCMNELRHAFSTLVAREEEYAKTMKEEKFYMMKCPEDLRVADIIKTTLDALSLANHQTLLFTTWNDILNDDTAIRALIRIYRCSIAEHDFDLQRTLVKFLERFTMNPESKKKFCQLFCKPIVIDFIDVRLIFTTNAVMETLPQLYCVKFVTFSFSKKCRFL